MVTNDSLQSRVAISETLLAEMTAIKNAIFNVRCQRNTLFKNISEARNSKTEGKSQFRNLGFLGGFSLKTALKIIYQDC